MDGFHVGCQKSRLTTQDGQPDPIAVRSLVADHFMGVGDAEMKDALHSVVESVTGPPTQPLQPLFAARLKRPEPHAQASELPQFLLLGGTEQESRSLSSFSRLSSARLLPRLRCLRLLPPPTPSRFLYPIPSPRGALFAFETSPVAYLSGAYCCASYCLWIRIYAALASGAFPTLAAPTSTVHVPSSHPIGKPPLHSPHAIVVTRHAIFSPTSAL
jgi:hypothetical protein